MKNNGLTFRGCIETVKLLSQYVRPAYEDEICADIYDRFNSDPDLLAIPVLSGTKPIGLLKRMEFLIRLADRFGRPLYSKQPATILMDSTPVIVESSMKIDALNTALVTNNQSALQEGFIVVENGEYVGVGSALTLLQANMRRAELQVEELKVARVVAEEASKAKTAFLANMSHELRTPLNAVIGFSELIKTQMSEHITCPMVLDYIFDIHNSGTHLLTMINSILDMSRIESGKYELVETEEEPDEIIDQAIRIVSAKALEKNIQIIKCLHQIEDGLFADAQLIKQALINLLGNAVKFSPEGSNVFVSLEQDTFGALSISVRDEGEGIPKDKIEEMLKPFTQLEGAFVRNHEGTGLGLSLVQAYVEAHDGQFELKNGEKEGAIATIYLPVKRTVLNAEVEINSKVG